MALALVATDTWDRVSTVQSEPLHDPSGSAGSARDQKEKEPDPSGSGPGVRSGRSGKNDCLGSGPHAEHRLRRIFSLPVVRNGLPALLVGQRLVTRRRRMKVAWSPLPWGAGLECNVGSSMTNSMNYYRYSFGWGAGRTVGWGK